MPRRWSCVARHEDTHSQVTECGDIEVHWIAQHRCTGWEHQGGFVAESQRSIRSRPDRRISGAESNVRRTNIEPAGAKRRQPHPHAIAANAGVHNLAQSLVVEASVRQLRGAGAWLDECRAPGSDPTIVALRLAVESCQDECDSRENGGLSNHVEISFPLG